MRNLRVSLVLRDVKRYFGFLYDLGYQTRGVAYHPEAFGNWEVVFESPECAIQVACDRNEIFVEFAPPQSNMKKRFGLQAMIFYLSEGEEILGHFEGNFFGGRKIQLEKLASLLRANLERITPFFGIQYEKYEADLLLAQQRYNQELVQRRIRSMKGRENSG